MTGPAPAADLAAFDAAHIWHPYGPLPAAPPALPVVAAEGTRLRLADGRELIDAMSSWWAVAHGHRNPRLTAAAHAQLGRMSHVMFGGLTHPPAVRLVRGLLDLVEPHLDRVFLADSGSVAVEVAVKMALQYQRATGHPERTRLMTWRGGYHGDTRAPMGVCDPDGGMHALWRGAIAAEVFAPRPPDRGAGPGEIDAYLAAVDAAVTPEVAAVIVEPVVQGAGGMRFHDHATVAGLRRICDERGLLLIADEIATGFGRAGDLFTSAAAGAAPDILCLGKALTGGMLTLAAALTTGRVAAAISRAHGGLMHGPTFMGNPLACAVAAEATAIIAEGDWRGQVPRIAAGLRAGLTGLAGDPRVAEVRALGAIGVVELHDPVDMAAATAAAVAEGVWLRPFGRLIYAMPMYISDDAEIARICRAMAAAVAAQPEPAR